MSDANSVSIAYVKETTYNTVPSGPPTLVEIPLKDESLVQDTTSQTSTTMRSDRQRDDVVRMNVKASGDINFNFRYSDYDPWLVSLLMGNAWASTVEIISANITVSVDSGTDTYTLASGTWTNTPTAGTWVEIRGFTSAGNNGYFKVASATTTTLVVENADGLVTEVAGDSIDIDQGEQIVNGTTLDSYYLEREFTDLTNIFATFGGMSIDAMSLEVNEASEIAGTFSWMGATENSGTSTIGDGSNTAASSNQEFNAVDHVPSVLENGSPVEVIKWDFNYSNNLRTRGIIGTLGAVSVGKGSIDVTGNLQMYFETATLFNKYLAWTSTSLAIQIEDDAGNAYVIDFPNVKFTSGKRVAGGLNTDIIADMQWTAYRDSAENLTARIVRFAA